MIAVFAAVAAADGSWQPFLLAIALLGELLAVVFVYRVLVRGGSPSSTLLWMLVILATPWFGLFLYYLLPRRLQLRRLRRLRVRGARLREVRPRSRSAGAADEADGVGQTFLQQFLRVTHGDGPNGNGRRSAPNRLSPVGWQRSVKRRSMGVNDFSGS